MIDNALHAILWDAANVADWDENTMLLMATRFLAELAGTNPGVADQFKAFLHDQVRAEQADSPGAEREQMVIPAEAPSDERR